MSKISLIAQREFLTRVRKKTFLLTTILLPLLIFGFYALIIYFSVQSSDTLNIAVADKANIFNKKIESKDEALKFIFIDSQDEAALKAKTQKGEYDAYLWIPAETSLMQAEKFKVTSNKAMGLMTQGKIESSINHTIENRRLLSLNLSPAQLDSIQHKEDVDFRSLEGNTEKKSAAGFSYAVGMISGFLIYLVLFIYGTMVMRGVMEEKVSRIAEVIISSVKPFQLMIGKILGIGAVGLLQFIIWILLVVGLQFLLPLIFPGLADQMSHQPIQPGGAQVMAAAKSGPMAEVMSGLSDLNLPLIAGCFIFYFVGGYLLYSSLFAAVGSAVNEDPQDAQSLLFPIMMPIIFSFAILSKACNNPTSGIAVFGSLFPLSSPIVMMGRIAYGVPNTVPVWQLVLSFVFLIAGFILTTWLAAKIYRTGILM
ncbi:MAG: transporter permease, partial [Chitinophagaceae bacterium]|nr:transporter permease [Chitinophagaceae bacterium]